MSQHPFVKGIDFTHEELRIGPRPENTAECKACGAFWEWETKKEYELAVDAIWSHCCQ